MIYHTNPRDIIDRINRREVGMKLLEDAKSEILRLRDENLHLRAMFNDFDAEVRQRVRTLTCGRD
jgi:hypothetical protein